MKGKLMANRREKRNASIRNHTGSRSLSFLYGIPISTHLHSYRERKDELPKMQVGFIDVICVPLYRILSDTFPWIRPLYDGTLDNRQHWQDLAEKVEMGLTWIDHDTIDKPVEEFSGWIRFDLCAKYI